MNSSKGPINEINVDAVKTLEGIYRKTLVYNNMMMLCQFILEKGAILPLHEHEAEQVGYLVSGKIKYITETRGEFIVETGGSYAFDSFEKHGAFIIEKSEVIDVFSPPRDDYKLSSSK